jgi:glycosyltransferase involved in cell wall biosynthesis
VRVHLVDPAAYTPPYDHALASALAAAGAEVTLVTGPFAHGAVPRGVGYAVDERFYRWSPGGAAPCARRAPGPARARHAALPPCGPAADVVHLQWLPVQPVDVHLLPARGPRLLTAHDVLPREPRPGQLAAQRRLYERMDAVVVHSEHGRGRLVGELGLDPALVEVIPHGAFTHLTQLPEERPLPARAGRRAARAPVVLFFGLLRPYKGLDVLLEAWRGIEDAELWVAGAPRGVDVAALRAAAPPTVRFEPRFITDPEIPALFRRADLVVLPYREIDQSGVLFTALAFGTPVLASAVGGFPEVAAHGAAELVAPGDPAALHDALHRLLADPARRAELATAARTAADREYAWSTIAERHLALYRRLTSGA